MDISAATVFMDSNKGDRAVITRVEDHLVKVLGQFRITLTSSYGGTSVHVYVDAGVLEGLAVETQASLIEHDLLKGGTN